LDASGKFLCPYDEPIHGDATDVHEDIEIDDHEPENYKKMEHDYVNDGEVSIENESNDET